MRVRQFVLAGVLLFSSVATALAQKGGAVEIGGFGRWTKFDSDLNFDNKIGFGGRFGIFVASNLAIEGDASYTTTHSGDGQSIHYIPIHAGLTLNVPLGKLGRLPAWWSLRP